MNVTPLGAREAGASPAIQPKRRLRRPTLSHAMIAIAVLLAFTFNFLALQDRGDTVLVAVLSNPLAPGATVESADLRFVPVAADFEGLDGLVTDGDWSEVEGWVVSRHLEAGAVLDLGSLNSPSAGPDGTRSMSIPVAPEHAAGGLIAIGDMVDVISVGPEGPFYVAEAIQVVDVAVVGSGGIGSISGYHIVVAVDAGQALEIAAAIESGTIDIVRATGALPISESG